LHKLPKSPSLNRVNRKKIRTNRDKIYPVSFATQIPKTAKTPETPETPGPSLATAAPQSNQPLILTAATSYPATVTSRSFTNGIRTLLAVYFHSVSGLAAATTISAHTI
jgi:hypothetical protein